VLGETYRLSPCPVAGHQITVLMFLTIKFLVCCVVDMALEIRTAENVLDRFARIPVPDVVLSSLPLWRVSDRGEWTLILEAGVIPLGITKCDGINLPVEISLVGDGWGVVVGTECGRPQLKKFVGLSLRELSIGKHELRKFETSLGCER
jgi:hypothetical protein